jgi:hypothetical protein
MSMKKIIMTTLALVIGVTVYTGTAFAAPSLNSPGTMGTMTVANGTTNPCSYGPINVNNCWSSSTTAKPGDMVAAQLYFKNTGDQTVTGVNLAIHPSRSGTHVSFTGIVAATNAPRVTGTASITLSQDTSITTMPQNGQYSANYYPSQTASAQPVNIDQALGDGFKIPDLAPGQQGVMVIRFKVNGETTTTPPAADCVINNFSANPNTIALGNTSSLTWNTSNCNYVSVSTLGSNLATDGTQTVTPTNTTTYTLTAYPGGKTATAIVKVTNNGGGGNTNTCSITSFNANPSSISYGGSSSLNWSTTNCDYVNISSLGNNFSANSSQTVYPSSTTTYTLTAYPGGITSTATVTVGSTNNNNSCYINSFYVDSNSILQGQTTTLHWSTSGSNSVYISGFGNQNSSGSLSISPYSSTTYTLTLSGSNCNNGASQAVSVTVNQNNNGGGGNTNYQQPQAITTVGNALSSYSAQLNGIAVPNSSYGTATAWFEYGASTSLGNRSDSQNVNGSGSYPYNAQISGLSGGRTYYFRAVVQTNAGTAYGSVVPFTTPAGTTYVPPTKVVYVNSATTTRSNTGLIAKSQPSLFKLQVDSNYDHMCIGGTVDYTVTYQNISAQQLDNSILRITFPGELTYASGSQGDYSVVDRTLTVSLGTVQPGEQGSVTVHAQVNDTAVAGKLAVITATIVYTNPATHAQENAIAYSLITVSNDCPAVLGASVFGFGGFLPTTLLGWLLLILIILALIVLARMLYRKNEKPV